MWYNAYEFCLVVKIIKTIINGYLKSLDNNDISEINTKGIKNNNKITYYQDNIIHNIIIEDNKITLIRENEEFKSIIEFIENETKQSYYLLKNNNIAIDLNIKTNKIINNENNITITYEIIDSNESYEYKIETR